MTLIPFSPSATSNPPFATQFTLDGAEYTCVVTWNFCGQRWYLSLTDQNNNLVLHRALVGSPEGFDINLVYGYFTTSTLIYRSGTGNFEVNP